MGSKTAMGDPTTFLKDSPSPVVWVAPNYRLGIFGFLAGPSFALAPGTVVNAGLYDQKLALQWVQDKIHLFNGQKDEVTVVGASAGAGSILHHITANGGEGDAPLFKRALPIGPGFEPIGGHSNAEEIFSRVEAHVGCSCSLSPINFWVTGLLTNSPPQVPVKASTVFDLSPQRY